MVTPVAAIQRSSSAQQQAQTVLSDSSLWPKRRATSCGSSCQRCPRWVDSSQWQAHSAPNPLPHLRHRPRSKYTLRRPFRHTRSAPPQRRLAFLSRCLVMDRTCPCNMAHALLTCSSNNSNRSIPPSAPPPSLTRPRQRCRKHQRRDADQQVTAAAAALLRRRPSPLRCSRHSRGSLHLPRHTLRKHRQTPTPMRHAQEEEEWTWVSRHRIAGRAASRVRRQRQQRTIQRRLAGPSWAGTRRSAALASLSVSLCCFPLTFLVTVNAC